MDHWLVQGIITNTVWALCVFAIGVLVAFLKYIGSRYADSLLYGLGAIVLTTVLIGGLKYLFYDQPPPPPPPLTPQNIKEVIREVLKEEAPAIDLQTQIRNWIDSAQYTSRVLEPSKSDVFKIVATGDIQFFVTQTKKNQNVVTLTTTVQASPALKAIPEVKYRKFMHLLNIDLALLGIEYAVAYEADNPQLKDGKIAGFQLKNEIPIDKTTTFTRFADGIFLMKRAITIMQRRADLTLPNGK